MVCSFEGWTFASSLAGRWNRQGERRRSRIITRNPATVFMLGDLGRVPPVVVIHRELLKTELAEYRVTQDFPSRFVPHGVPNRRFVSFAGLLVVQQMPADRPRATPTESRASSTPEGKSWHGSNRVALQKKPPHPNPLPRRRRERGQERFILIERQLPRCCGPNSFQTHRNQKQWREPWFIAVLRLKPFEEAETRRITR